MKPRSFGAITDPRTLLRSRSEPPIEIARDTRGLDIRGQSSSIAARMPSNLPRLPGLHDLSAFVRLFELRTVSRWVGIGLAVGVVSGLCAAAFFAAMDGLRSLVFVKLAQIDLLEPQGEHSLFGAVAVGEPRRWLILLLPAIGGLISGVIVFSLAPEAEGHGTDSLIEAFHRKGGNIRARVPWVKAVASVILIGTGGSAGREGPIAQMGAGFGSILGGFLKLSPRERRLLLLAGAAGGIGAIFRTPLGAALFVVEVLYRDDFEVDGLVPTVLSSVVAYSVFTMIFGTGAIFATAPHYDFDPRQLPFYLLMAIGAAALGIFYVKIFYGTRDRVFAKLRLPRAIRPMIGGLGVGCLALFIPQALGAGYGWLQEAIVPTRGLLPTGWWGAAVLLGIALIKVITTSLSVSSGGSGGVFGPSIVIGGMVGGAFGLAFHELVPGLVPDPGAFVIVGMACFFGGVAHAPISSLVMGCEMTASYDLLVPIMLAEAVAVVVVGRHTLYEKQVATRRESPAHGGEYVLDVLQDVRVGQVFEAQSSILTVAPSTSLEELLRQAAASSQVVFPVVDAGGDCTGVVTLETVRAFFYDEAIGRLAIAADCAAPLVSVSRDDSLALALKRCSASHFPQIPVIDPDTQSLVGLLSYEEILQSYSQEVLRRRLEADGASLP
ncbi:MAG: chloride channel protein [Polyangiaceae bacterium]|nr:chloride channel protein [Polyangiaceae bacterium]